jgi:hypothetical protein
VSEPILTPERYEYLRGLHGWNSNDVTPATELVREIDRLRNDLARVTAERDYFERCDTEKALERDKLQAFKDWVHAYLDQHGVPHHPPGTHGAEGCRIGDRMDWLMNLVDELRRGLEPFAAFPDPVLLEDHAVLMVIYGPDLELPRETLRRRAQYIAVAHFRRAAALLAKYQTPAAPEGEQG